MDESFYIQFRSIDATHVDSDGKRDSSSSWHGWTFQWRWSSNATTGPVPSSDFIFAAAECSAQSTTCYSSCIPHPPASTVFANYLIFTSSTESCTIRTSTTEGSTRGDNIKSTSIQPCRDGPETSKQLEKGDGEHSQEVPRHASTSNSTDSSILQFRAHPCFVRASMFFPECVAKGSRL